MMFPLLLCGTASQADVRVALVGAELSATGQAAVELAEADLSARGDVILLDRAAIGQVLREQNLAAEGFARPDDAVRLGQLLAVDLFIHVEAIRDRPAVAIVAFETAQGIRLLDEVAAGDAADVLADGIAAAVGRASAKWQAPAGQTATIALAGVRNVDLPEGRRGECDSLGTLLERRLLGSPDMVMVERKRLQSLNMDRELAPNRPDARLLSAPVLLELDIGQAGTDGGLQVTAFLSDPQGRIMAKATSTGSLLPALADQLSSEILAALKKKAALPAADPALEAARFFGIARFWKGQGRLDQALAAAEAAHALVPADPDLQALLVNALFDSAETNLSTNRFAALAQAARGMALLRQPVAGSATADPELEKPRVVLAADNASFFRSFGKSVDQTRKLRPFSDEEADAYAGFCRDWLADSPFSPAATRAPSGWELLLFVDDYAPYFPDPESAWRVLVPQVECWSRERLDQDPPHVPGDLLAGLVAAGDSERNPLPPAVYPIRADLWGFFEGQENPLLCLYGRCGRIVDAARANAAGKWADEAASREFLDELFAKLIAPGDAKGVPREQLYAVAQLAIRRSGRQPGAWSTFRYERRQQQFVETLALFRAMLKAGDVRGEVVVALRNPLLNPKSLGSLKLAEWGLRELDAAMASAATAPAGMFAPEKLRELEEFRDWVRGRMAPGSTAIAPAPGRRIEPVDVPKLSGRFRGYSALVADEAGVYVLSAFADPSRLSMQKFLPDSRTCIALGTTPLEGPNRDSPVSPHVAGVVDACLGERCVAVAVKDEGVFLFDRTVAKVVRLHETTSLPVTHPLAVGVLGRNLYVGTDDGYLVAFDVDSGSGEIVVASSRKEKKSPFDDGPPARISALFPDPVRNRMVFEVSVVAPESQLGMAVSEASGIWEYRVDSGEFRQRVVYRHRAADVRWCKKVAADEFVYDDVWGTVLKYDLATDALDWLASGPKGPSRVFEKQLIQTFELDRPRPGRIPLDRRTTAVSPPFLMRGEWLWTAKPWGRLSLKTCAWEAQPSFQLSGGRTITPAPDVGMVPAGEGRILLADRLRLWLLTEEPGP